jgi:hypothetical protein
MLSAESRSPQHIERLAVSLKSLAKATMSGPAKKDAQCRDSQALAGLGWLEGYVLDPENADIILVGRRNPSRPHLHLDDLVAGMRSMWGGHDYPYCSLDPKADDVRRLNLLLTGESGVTSLQQIRKLCEQVRQACGGQNVVVGGVPRNSRHAHVMVDADYHMKKVAQGHAHIPGIMSMIDRPLNEAIAAIRAGNSPPAAQISMARFWFHFADGHPTFRESEDIVWLDKASVVLLTERQRAAADGTLYDVPGDDPYTRGFAQDFSARLDDAAATASVYADLENLFRLQALLAAMHFRRAAESTRPCGLEM